MTLVLSLELVNPAFADVFRHPRLAEGGGGVKRHHVITRERMATERRPLRRSKALDETILKHPLNFPNEVTSGQGQVKSQNRGFQVTRSRDFKTIGFGPIISTPKI